MLVLRRNVNDAVLIRIGDVEVRVLVVELDRYQVRLGFDAPDEVRIVREEISREPKKQKEGG